MAGLTRTLTQRASRSLAQWADPLRLPTPWEWAAYVTDFTQRSVLFLDVLRERARNAAEHEAAGQPPLLDFAYEVVVDGRTLPRPVNYALLRIVPPPGRRVDAMRRPLVVIDPRAGHGAGIGGFKPDSQVGEGLAAGHPVYFVSFSPVPEPGQTLGDIGLAEAHFVETVAALHPDSPKPCVIGNCQAGWAALGMAAARPGRVGMVIVNGAPVSYWAGVTGQNPLRYSAGLVGGGWLTRLLADLGNGRFDGAWLVSNFESLDPANSFWSKYYHLFANVDKEAPRFLAFERWWTGYTLFNADEIEMIVDDLFIGNRLAARERKLRGAPGVDLRAIDAPIVVFCSSGDNITPPQQALNWIADLYPSDQALREAGQTIVYLRHARAGHLGLFVSAAVARREHREMFSACDAIAALPPGLYEMTIDDGVAAGAASNGAVDGAVLSAASTAAVDGAGHGAASAAAVGAPVRQVGFALRNIADLAAHDADGRADEALFPLVSRVSDRNNALYETAVRPWVRAMIGEAQACALRQAHPLRLTRTLTGERNPWMRGVAALAGPVRASRAGRAPLPADNPLLAWQHRAAAFTEAALDSWRDCRDASAELAFHAIYGMLACGWTAGASMHDATARPGTRAAPALETSGSEGEHAAQERDLLTGGVPDAVVRLLLLAVGTHGRVGKTGLVNCTRALQSYYAPREDAPHEALRDVVHRQNLLVHAFPEPARRTLPQLLGSARERALAAQIATAVAPELAESDDERIRALWSEAFGPRAEASQTSQTSQTPQTPQTPHVQLS